MPLREGGETRDDIADPETGRHAHSQEPTKLAALADAMFRLFERRENGFDAGQKLAARLSGHDGACGARQEAHAQFRLEVGNDARDLGLRQTALAGGGREAAEAGDPRIETQCEIVLDQRNQAPAGEGPVSPATPINVSNTFE